jgi:hypothetical protein
MWVYKIIICSITSVFSGVKLVDRQTEYPYAIHAKTKGYAKPSCRLPVLYRIKIVDAHSVTVGFSVWVTMAGM